MFDFHVQCMISCCLCDCLWLIMFPFCFAVVNLNPFTTTLPQFFFYFRLLLYYNDYCLKYILSFHPCYCHKLHVYSALQHIVAHTGFAKFHEKDFTKVKIFQNVLGGGYFFWNTLYVPCNFCFVSGVEYYRPICSFIAVKQEVKVIWQKAPHGGPIPRLGVTPGGRKLYHWIPGVGFPISVP